MDIGNSSLGAIPIADTNIYPGLGQPAKRQTGYCDPGSHPCEDIGSSLCCANNEYCYADNNFQASCCAIGTECTSNPCATSLILCATNMTVSGTATSTTTCCLRSCSASSAFKCASSFGGGCCSVDSTCGISGTSKLCISTVDPNTVTSAGFTGGPTTSSAVRTGPSGSISTSFSTVPKPHGLSTGAKVGIGVGVTLGCSLLLGALVYLFITRRRRNAETPQAETTNDVAPGGVMTESSPTSRLSPRSPGGTDYFGPTAREGPYTEREGVSSPHSTDRGVPLSPQVPGDIAAPVEIADSKQTPKVPPPPPDYVPEREEPIYELA